MMSIASLRARQLLETVEEGRTQVARLQRTVAHLEERCTATTRRCDGVIVSAGSDRDGLLAELADQRSLLLAQQQKLRLLTDTLEQWIDLLPRPRWRMVLRYRYLEGLDLQDVCRALSGAAGHSFSMSQIYRLHRQALLAAEELWPRTLPSPLTAPAPIGCGISPVFPAATAPRKPAANAWSGPQRP